MCCYPPEQLGATPSCRLLAMGVFDYPRSPVAFEDPAPASTGREGALPSLVLVYHPTSPAAVVKALVAHHFFYLSYSEVTKEITRHTGIQKRHVASGLPFTSTTTTQRRHSETPGHTSILQWEIPAISASFAHICSVSYMIQMPHGEYFPNLLRKSHFSSSGVACPVRARILSFY